MSLKKVLSLALAGVMAIGMGVTASAGPLSFWTLQGRMNAVDPLTEKWNEENPDFQVTVSYFDTDGIKDNCKVAASSDTLPSMWFNWGGSLGQFYVDNGKTMDMTDFAAANGWDEKFSAGALQLCHRYRSRKQLHGCPDSLH